MKNSCFVFISLSFILLVPVRSTASIDVYINDRDTNSLGLETSFDTDDAYISRLDCIEDITFELYIDISDEDTDGRELYLFSGSNCDDTDDESGCDDDVIRLDAEDTVVDIPVSWILDDESCTTSTSSAVYVGLLENAYEKDDNATWGSSISFDIDGTPPAAPTDIFAELGDEKLLVSFVYDEDDSFEGALLLYAEADQQVEVDGGVTDDADAGVSDECTGALVEGGDVTGDLNYVEITDGSVEEGYIRSLTNGVTYQIAVAAIDENGNVSPVSEVICEAPGETVSFLDEYLNAGGESGEYCFVATAAFGDYDHPTVRILRTFRDQFLRAFGLGRAFISLYYEVGPTLATYIQNDVVRQAVRVMLTLVSGVALVLIQLGPFMTMLCVAMMLALLLLLAAKRHRSRPIRQRVVPPSS